MRKKTENEINAVIKAIIQKRGFMENKSFWLLNIQPDNYPRLDANIETDVTVCGAGIAGILCAYRLVNMGFKVVLIDSGKIGGGVSSGSTGKITSQHGLIYD